MERNEVPLTSSEHQEEKEHDDISGHGAVVVRHASDEGDILRLFKLIFTRAEFFAPFARDRFPTPINASVQDLDANEEGFWARLTKAFRDDQYDIGQSKSPAAADGSIDPSVCKSKSARPYDLLCWYRDVERASSRSLSVLPPVEELGIPSSATVPTVAEEEPAWKTVEIVEPVEGPKKVLVTGGAGFIGSHVADHLLARGDSVVIVDEVNDYYDVTIKESNLTMLTNKYGKDRLFIYRGDICDEAFIMDIFDTHHPEYICHMAARAGVRPSIQDPYVYIHSNIKGTTQLMDFCVKYGCKNFVFASSSSVYGESKASVFREEDVVDHPVSPYAASKKACELLSYTYHHLYKFPVTGLRFFTVYGPRGRPDMAPYKFIDRCSRGIEIEQYGDGSSSRDYTYIEDIVDGVVRAIDRPYPYEIFNLGKGSGTSLKEFLDLVQKYVGKPAKIKVLPDQPGDVPYTCADVSKAGRLLGYVSKVPFEEGIKRTVEWYKEFEASKVEH